MPSFISINNVDLLKISSRCDELGDFLVIMYKILSGDKDLFRFEPGFVTVAIFLI